MSNLYSKYPLVNQPFENLYPFPCGEFDDIFIFISKFKYMFLKYGLMDSEAGLGSIEIPERKSMSLFYTYYCGMKESFPTVLDYCLDFEYMKIITSIDKINDMDLAEYTLMKYLLKFLPIRTKEYVLNDILQISIIASELCSKKTKHEVNLYLKKTEEMVVS